MRTRTLPWRILIKGQRPGKPINRYNVFCEFPRWISAEDAKAACDAIQAKFPAHRFLATNREDWNHCYNSIPNQ